HDLPGQPPVGQRVIAVRGSRCPLRCLRRQQAGDELGVGGLLRGRGPIQDGEPRLVGEQVRGRRRLLAVHRVLGPPVSDRGIRVVQPALGQQRGGGGRQR